MIKQNNPLPQSRTFFLFSCFLSIVFIGLGTWQLERKKQKEALLQSLATVWEGKIHNVDETKDPPLLKAISAEGHYVPGKTIFLQSRTYRGKNGVYVLDIFRTLKDQFILVQRGWSHKERIAIPSGDIKIEGIARAPSTPTYFQPLNKPPIYFWIDLKKLSQTLNLPLLPFYLVAKNTNDDQIFPVDAMPLPPNHHLQYAITWYSLAFAILSMLLWSRKNNLVKETS